MHSLGLEEGGFAKYERCQVSWFSEVLRILGADDIELLLRCMGLLMQPREVDAEQVAQFRISK